MIIGKSLTALGGGLKPEIRVTAKAGSLLNLRFKDSSIILKSIQLGSSETTHTFVADVSDTAYVVDDATNGKSVEVLVDTVAVFDTKIPYEVYLYKDGDEFEDVTGGWTGSGWSRSGYSVSAGTKRDTYMYLPNGAGVSTSRMLGTSNMINLEPHSKVYIDCYTGPSDNQFNCSFAILKSRSVDSAIVWIRLNQFTRGIREIDISDISEEDYLTFFTDANDGRFGYIYQVWLD